MEGADVSQGGTGRYSNLIIVLFYEGKRRKRRAKKERKIHTTGDIYSKY
jgi:hypothetical protein